MGVYVYCDFNLGSCLENLGLNERGRVQQEVSNAVLELCDDYVPFAEGGLKDSGHIEDDTDVVWDTAYSRYMWNGIVYEDPDLHCAGFKTENGWRSRKDVQKVPTTRSLQYANGSHRGAHWAERMLQEGGREEVERRARKAASE